MIVESSELSNCACAAIIFSLLRLLILICNFNNMICGAYFWSLFLMDPDRDTRKRLQGQSKNIQATYAYNLVHISIPSRTVTLKKVEVWKFNSNACPDRQAIQFPSSRYCKILKNVLIVIENSNNRSRKNVFSNETKSFFSVLIVRRLRK